MNLQYHCDTIAWTNLRDKSATLDERHPETVMKELGISWLYGKSISMASMWEFWGCTNVPKSLPEFISINTGDPMERIGCGLSLEEAEKLQEQQ